MRKRRTPTGAAYAFSSTDSGYAFLSPGDIPQELLEKYVTSGPRYTSYPTAPQFRSDFDVQELHREWAASNGPRGNVIKSPKGNVIKSPKGNVSNSPQENVLKSPLGKGLSLYLHIPFCRRRCLYCGCFTRVERDQETAALYVNALLRESDRLLKLVSPERPVEQLALGGGTPNFLSPENMRRLMEGLRERFNFDPAGERSIEIDPRIADEDYLDLLVSLGFNRFSFGVQDLDERVQQIIGRVCEEERLFRLVNHLRRRRIDAVNLDLIHGLPGQTLESFGRTIDEIIRQRPSRIALFGYAHVPWMGPHQRALEAHGIPGPEAKTALFGLAFDRLLSAGYEHVGMDHFALPDDELIRALRSRTLTRNFMGYTTRRGLDLVGMGASAISSVGRTYTQNLKDIDGYMDVMLKPDVAAGPDAAMSADNAVGPDVAANTDIAANTGAAGGLAWFRGLVLDAEDELRRDIIIDLFCNFHLDLASKEKKWGVDFKRHFAHEIEALLPLEEDGFLKITARELAVSELGRFFIRNICMVFDAYLGKNPAARYSRTI